MSSSCRERNQQDLQKLRKGCLLNLPKVCSDLYLCLTTLALQNSANCGVGIQQCVIYTQARDLERSFVALYIAYKEELRHQLAVEFEGFWLSFHQDPSNYESIRWRIGWGETFISTYEDILLVECKPPIVVPIIVVPAEEAVTPAAVETSSTVPLDENLKSTDK